MLKCKINEKEYDIVQGNTFSEEYNETLDSGSIIIDQVDKIDLKPYDDVYIYSDEKEFKGYTYAGQVTYTLPINSEMNFGFNFSVLTFTQEDYTKINILESSIIITNLDTQSNTEYFIDTNASTESNIIFKEKSDITQTVTFALNVDEKQYEATFAFLAQVTKSEIIGTLATTVQKPSFYKHFLIDQYNEELINLKDKIYKYKIELFSETKKLETIQLPNISITQPRNIHKKKSVYTYLQEFVETYTPYFKMSLDGTTWNYIPKYTLDPQLATIFSDVYAPEFSLNNPNLRDILSNLMLTKDMIPYVEDDVIKAMDITLRRGTFNPTGTNYITASRSSDNYCDNLRRSYSNALAQENSSRFIEYMGLRNSDNALMTLENMRIETRFPIYKINKIYLCYYKRGKVIVEQTVVKNFEKTVYIRDYDIGSFFYRVEGTIDNASVSITSSNPNISTSYTITTPTGTTDNLITIRYSTIEEQEQTGTITVYFEFQPTKYGQDRDKIFLCKQDITPLVKLNSERNLLIQTWDDFSASNPTDIEDMAKYKLCTLGYDIGSNYITGFGTKYTYVPQGTWWDITKTYIENVITKVDEYTPFGIYQYEYLAQTIGGLEEYERFTTTGFNIYQRIINPFIKPDDSSISYNALLFKSFFFEIDYDGFYNGAVVHSKDGADDDVTINDNSSSSLTVLEKDGLFQKEKANRFGNEAIVINARYTNINQLQPLGSVYGDDIIIYHRQYSYYNNVINATYYGTKDYVLKNYFTSVYAKHRPYNLMSYGESTTRSENRKAMILMSKNQSYYEFENKKLVFDDFENYLQTIMSFFTPSELPNSIDAFENKDKINYSIIQDKYLSDTNVFVSGTSLCFNMRAFDNVSGGIYVKKKVPFFNKKVNDSDDYSQPKVLWDTLISNFYTKAVKDDYTGSLQDWYMSVDDIETGHTDEMTFEVSHFNKKGYFLDYQIIDNEQDVQDAYVNLFKMPLIPTTPVNKTNVIRSYGVIHKDNKEVVDMTFQIEPITNNNDVIFSQWLMKLSNLNGTYLKFAKDTEVVDTWGYETRQKTLCGTYVDVLGGVDDYYYNIYPYMALQFNEVDFENEIKAKFQLNNVLPVQITFDYEEMIPANNVTLNELPLMFFRSIIKYTFIGEKITYLTDDEIRVEGYEEIGLGSLWNKKEPKVWKQRQKTYVFKRINGISTWSVPQGDILFSNCTFDADGHITGDFSNFDVGAMEIDGERYEFFAWNGRIWYKNVFNYNSAIRTQDFQIGIDKNSTKTYLQNLFIVEDTEALKKEVVYDEFATLTTSNLKANEIIEYNVDDLSRPYLRINLANVASGTKSIQLWYRDNIQYIRRTTHDPNEEYDTITWEADTSKASYHFVFGVNLTDEDLANEEVKIYLSALSLRNINVYNENHIKIGTNLNYANSDQEYGIKQLVDGGNNENDN